MIIMRGARLDLELIMIRMLMGLLVLEGGRIGWRWMIVGRGDGWFLIDWALNFGPTPTTCDDLSWCFIFLASSDIHRGLYGIPYRIGVIYRFGTLVLFQMPRVG